MDRKENEKHTVIIWKEREREFHLLNIDVYLVYSSPRLMRAREFYERWVNSSG